MITYTISTPAPHSHLVHITLDVDGLNGEHLDLLLPAWTPGSYMIREFARHVQGFHAQAGEQALAWDKIDKHTWRVETRGAPRIQVHYQVYANELTVRTSHLDATHGYFNPANLAMYVPGRTQEPLIVDVVVPASWQVATGLKQLEADVDSAPSDPGHYRFQARDYDELVDSPFHCGGHELLRFEIDGIPHEIVIWGHGNYDPARLVDDTRRIVETTRDMFGELPYERYLFLLLLVDKGVGGLEHRNSVTNMLPRWSFRPARSYERYLSLTSHEFFHVWCVKRLRPAPLGPFDYQRENYTRQLWAMEGLTSFYDDLLLARAALLSPERYLEILAEQIVQLQSQPGRALQSLEQSSFDAWIKFYRPDENSANSSISYYLKGALVALLADMEIRRRTDNEHSLDDALRNLLASYPPAGPGIPEQGGWQAAFEELTDHDWTAFFARFVAGREELDYAAYLEAAGLELRWSHKEPGPEGTAPPWLGLVTKNEQGRLLVSYARADGPAYAAGVYAGDEVLALDGWRVDHESLQARLTERSVGETVTLSVFRRDQLLHLPILLAPAPPDKLVIERVAEPSAKQRQIYESWLGLPSES
jgi:predicted metalloprotease with PDZ domain